MEQKQVTRKKNKPEIKDDETKNLLVYKQKGNTVIRIYGDSVLSEEEQQKALERCKEIG
jgi:hypothetical protein